MKRKDRRLIHALTHSFIHHEISKMTEQIEIDSEHTFLFGLRYSLGKRFLKIRLARPTRPTRARDCGYSG